MLAFTITSLISSSSSTQDSLKRVPLITLQEEASVKGGRDKRSSPSRHVKLWLLVQRIVAEVDGLCLEQRVNIARGRGREPSSLTSQSTMSHTRAIPEVRNG